MTLLNTTFKEKSNTLCNNILFNGSKMPLMDEKMTRLYLAASELKGVTGQSNLAKALGVSPQIVKNWESRGPSKQGIVNAQQVIGCSATWIETGLGPMRVSGWADNEIRSKPQESGLGFSITKQKFINEISKSHVDDRVIETLQSVLDLAVRKKTIKTEVESEIPGLIKFRLVDQNLQPQNKLMEYKARVEERRKSNIPVTVERRIAGRRDGDDN